MRLTTPTNQTGVPAARASTAPFAPSRPLPVDGRARVSIENITPQVDGGRFPAKRVIGDSVRVEADVFADGHDVISAALLYQQQTSEAWSESQLYPLREDRWHGSFPVESLGTHRYVVMAWVDHFATWRRDMRKWLGAAQSVEVDRLVGAELIAEASANARGPAIELLEEYDDRLRGGDWKSQIEAIVADPELAQVMYRWAPRRFAVRSPELSILVERDRARFSAWYEMFPRSAASEPRHGTLRDVEACLPYVAAMGFDVLYLPPIHPIGASFRKGRNNSPEAQPGDAGSPWAIGSGEGGHKHIHPDLGTLDDFRRLRAAALQHGLELAMDIAFQCSPDHPYVEAHPEWFRQRPDGSIQYAENPPKKYQDIYPFNFECDAWQSLWQELKSIFVFWAEEGVRIFRVDNPHTKPFGFWEWLIADVRRAYPDAIFLAEAFTRQPVMYELAKLGFSQSYTYFTWRNSKHELTEYFSELWRPEVRDFFRPNLWPATPDILPEPLQRGARGAFMARVTLAAMLSGNFGIYGPPFEHGWSAPLRPGSEEYLNSEKYEVHHHRRDRPDSLKDYIARLNSIRRGSAALTHDAALQFHATDNDQVICFSRSTDDLWDIVVVVVNLDPYHAQSAWVELPLEKFCLPVNLPFQMHDLLNDAAYRWSGAWNFVRLDPHYCPAHVVRVRRHVRTENGVEHFE
jgi:starch synthase (maltosyl-transferring)